MPSPTRPSCTVREFPIPEREYRVVPRKSHRRPSRHLLLLALALFGGGFLLGWASAAGQLPHQETADLSGQIFQPAEPAGGTVPVQLLNAAPVTDASARQDDWELLLINGTHPLPEEFTIPELASLGNGHTVDSRIYSPLQALLNDARAAGYQPLVCSSFRTWDKQDQLFQNKVRRVLAQGVSPEEAEAEAAMWVARPGTSEHQAGLAVDLVDASYQLLDRSQEDRPVQQWLMAHCAEYGFILRYPTEKSNITGVGYEPWHYRYVGVEAASAIMEQGICLEEYLQS